jgi:hypothetical protein
VVCSALSKWQEAAHEQRRLSSISARVMARWLNAGACSLLTAWRQHVEKRNQLEHIASKIVLRSRGFIKGTACRFWRTSAKELRRLRRVASKVLLRWRDATLSSALAAWRVHASERRRQEAVTMRALQGILRRAEVSAWNSWLDAVQEGRWQADTRAEMEKMAELRGLVQEHESKSAELQQQLQVHIRLYLSCQYPCQNTGACWRTDTWLGILDVAVDLHVTRAPCVRLHTHVPSVKDPHFFAEICFLSSPCENMLCFILASVFLHNRF